MTDLLITSAANPRLKAITALRRRRVRDEHGLTVIDGVEELTQAVSSGVRPTSLFTCPELYGDAVVAARLVEAVRAAGAQVVQLSRAAFEKVAYREGPDGILAIVPAPGGALPASGYGGPTAPLILLAEGVEKPGNLGAMLRTADAAGVDLVMAADPVTDWGNPNVVRASKGTVFAVPCASTSVATGLTWCAGHGIAVVATTPDTDLDYADVDYRGPVAIAVGAEKHGLSEAVLAAATYRVRIPMAGRADSLNVSVSAAIVLYEAVRQRRLG